MSDVELTNSLDTSVEDILDLEIGELRDLEFPEELPKSYYVRIPIRQETYQALVKIKKSKGLTWDGVIRWLIEVARAKKSQLAVKCPEKEEDLLSNSLVQGFLQMILGGGKA